MASSSRVCIPLTLLQKPPRVNQDNYRKTNRLMQPSALTSKHPVRIKARVRKGAVLEEGIWGERRFPFSFRLTVPPPLQGWFIICRHPRAASARRPQEKTRTPGPQNVAAFEIGFDLSRSFQHRSLSLPQIIQGGGGRLSNLNLILLAIAMSSFNTVFDEHNYFVWPNSTTLGTTFESADTIDAIFITNHSPAYVSSNCSCNGFKSYFTYATPRTSFTFGGTYVHRT